MENYHFSDFTLCGGQILYYKNKIVTVPPKEIAVLHLLVKNVGRVISKDDIIKEVWKGGEVSDESLSRCIYVLRKILSEGSSYRYINTVYGKGYLFVMDVFPVNRMPFGKKNEQKDTIAIFPFIMQDKMLSTMIFSFINHNSAIFEAKGFHVLPTTLTINSHNITETFINLKMTGVRYFLTGTEIKADSTTVIKVEFIDSNLLTVIFQESIFLSSDNFNNLVNFKNVILNFLNKISKKDEGVSNDFIYQTDEDSKTRNNFINFPYFPVELYKKLDFHPLMSSNCDSIKLFHLASCYFSLVSLGVINFEEAEKFISDFTEKVLTDEPCNALAISMKNLICRDIYTKDKKSNFGNASN